MKQSKQSIILEKVKSIGRRWLRRRIIDAACVGLFFSGSIIVLGLMFGLWYGVQGWGFSLPSAACLVTVVGCVCGIIAGMVRWPSLRDTARLIDRKMSLADRVSTSIQVLEHDKPNELEQLQLADTAERLVAVLPENVVAYRFPRIAFAVVLIYFVAALSGGMLLQSDKMNLGKNAPISSDSVINDLPTNDSRLFARISEERKNRQPLSEKTKNKILTAVSQATRSVPDDKIIRTLEEETKSRLATLSRNELSLHEHVAAWTGLETALHAMTQRLTDEINRQASYKKTDEPNFTMKNGSASNGRQAVIKQLKEAIALVELEMAAFIESQRSDRENDLVRTNDSLEGSSLHGNTPKDHEGSPSRTGNENWSRESGSVAISDSAEHLMEKVKTEVSKEHVSGLDGKGPSRREIIAGSEKTRTETQTRRYQGVRTRFSGEVEQAMENETIPVSRRQMIRQYFDLLDETDGKPAP